MCLCNLTYIQTHVISMLPLLYLQLTQPTIRVASHIPSASPPILVAALNRLCQLIDHFGRSIKPIDMRVVVEARWHTNRALANRSPQFRPFAHCYDLKKNNLDDDWLFYIKKDALTSQLFLIIHHLFKEADIRSNDGSSSFDIVICL